MLAENTAIDAATDWRSAMDMLREDSRYKAVEDARERAELFADFQAELLKKEKADGMAARGRALQALEAALLRMQELGVLDRRSGWPEHKAALLQLLTRAEYRPLGESDLRRAFQQFVDNLEAEHRSKEKSRRDHFTEEVRQQLSLLREHLRSLAADGECPLPRCAHPHALTLPRMIGCRHADAIVPLPGPCHARLGYPECSL